MSELAESEIVKNVEQGLDKKEVGILFPELIANSPLKNTSLVYSIPVMGEWKNGNLQRLLQGMFSQRTNKGEAFEVEIIANIGPYLDNLLIVDFMAKTGYKQDDQGRFILETEPKNEKQKEALNLLDESNIAIGFLKQVVEVQRLARLLKGNPKEKNNRDELDKILKTPEDPLQRNILRLAVNKADDISLAIIDATHSAFPETKHKYTSISSLRTLGVDIATTRFADHQEVVLGLYDADTVPENNNTVKDLQQIFDQYPNLNYLFTGMTYLPPGHSRAFVTDSPRATIDKGFYYNTSMGSPQILFRLRAYEKLKEITGLRQVGWTGYEDMDTVYKLLYHFGNLQDGLLLENKGYLYPPSMLTTDRLAENDDKAGFDSSGRKFLFSKFGARDLTEDLGHIFDLRTIVTQYIRNQPIDKQQVILDTLSHARNHFENKQKIQQRFNRLVLNSFLNALDNGCIKFSNGQLETKDNELVQLKGGKALLNYIRGNPDLIGEVLSSSEDLMAIRYLLGRSSSKLPQNYSDLSPFQLAINEYIGDVEPIDKLVNEKVIAVEKKVKEVPYGTPNWFTSDLRKQGSRISLLHSAVAELMALGYVYKTYFQTNVFLESRDRRFEDVWPENPENQKLEMDFGELKDRLQKIKENINVEGTPIPEIERQLPRKGFLSHIHFQSIPIFGLLRSLLK